eukprot:scaffold3474_cov246-Pinguiococcus_pyrenoidosus.AAC.12
MEAIGGLYVFIGVVVAAAVLVGVTGAVICARCLDYGTPAPRPEGPQWYVSGAGTLARGEWLGLLRSNLGGGAGGGRRCQRGGVARQREVSIGSTGA